MKIVLKDEAANKTSMLTMLDASPRQIRRALKRGGFIQGVGIGGEGIWIAVDEISHILQARD